MCVMEDDEEAWGSLSCCCCCGVGGAGLGAAAGVGGPAHTRAGKTQ